MDILDNEILKLWSSLHAEGVRYIMIGGFATNLHGFARTTADMDLWIKDNKENRQSLYRALNKMDIYRDEILVDAPLVPGWSSITLHAGFELDIMTFAAGLSVERFEECYEAASIAEIQSIPVRFLHINDLIRSKEASNRPKDQIDLIELKRIRSERELG